MYVGVPTLFAKCVYVDNTQNIYLILDLPHPRLKRNKKFNGKWFLYEVNYKRHTYAFVKELKRPGQGEITDQSTTDE